MDIDDITDALRAVARARESAVAEVENLTAQRNRLIIVCYRAGLTMREIARFAGIHYTQVGSIVREIGLDPDDPANGAHNGAS